MKVRQISHDCGIGACPSVFETTDGDLIIVGATLTSEERRAVARKMNLDGETAVRIPKSLIANLKF